MPDDWLLTTILAGIFQGIWSESDLPDEIIIHCAVGWSDGLFSRKTKIGISRKTEHTCDEGAR